MGAVLTELRVKKDWSQRKLADVLGYDQSYVQQLERGMKSPTLRTLEVSDLVGAVERRIKR